MKLTKIMGLTLLAAFVVFSASPVKAYTDEDSSRNILKQGLLGAGTGAIASSASGGNAGKGALIGAGTNVIGGALLDTLFSGGSSQQQPRQQQVVYAQQPQYVQQASQYVQSTPAQQQGYVDQQPVYVQQGPVYQTPQEDPNKKILKSGLLGAGTGALASSMSGGDAGKGALIGAGTNVIGGALLDTLTAPSQPQQPQVVYVQQAPQQQYQQYAAPRPSNQGNVSSVQPKKKIIRKYDSDGRVVSEEETWE